MSTAMNAIARRLIRKLHGLGNFDEFRDDRERNGINEAAVYEIADFLHDNADAIEKATR